jgi:prepilin-type N-terminal cleavage/methylation domain-containing protein
MNQKAYYKFSENKGYTLIEVLVAMAIFFVLVAGPTGLFVASLRNQTRILGLREVIDNTSYSLEYMSRALRMAKKELNCGNIIEPNTCKCLKDNGYGFNYEVTRSGKGIRFNNYQNPSVCQEFFWDESDGRLKEKKGTSASVPLTADNLKVVSFKIAPGDGTDHPSWDQADVDNRQPRVVIFLEIEGGTNLRPEARSRVKVQTTVSQRNLDVIY